MRIKRVLVAGEAEFQAWNGAHWVRLPQSAEPEAAALESVLSLLQLDPDDRSKLASVLAELPPAADGQPLIPFRPLSYRDFMLHEAHCIQASRGYVKRFHPILYRVTSAIEALTRQPLSRFCPNRLWYRQPIYYMGNPLNFVSEGAEVAWPSYTQALDYELELGFLLARPLLNASPAEAEQAIGGFVVFNDFSARDVQLAEMRSGFGPQKSKHFCSAISAELVTADEILPLLDELTGEVAINGTTVAKCAYRGARFALGEALAHASRDEPLHAGEFFATGTWPGGCGMENGHWLKPGDTLRLTIDGVGSLSNTIAARQPIER